MTLLPRVTTGASAYLPTAHIVFCTQGIRISCHDNAANSSPFDLLRAEVLESYALSHEETGAYNAYRRLASTSLLHPSMRRLEDALSAARHWRDPQEFILITFVGARVIGSIGKRGVAFLSKHVEGDFTPAPVPHDLTALCQSHAALMRAAASLEGFEDTSHGSLSLPEFQAVTADLVAAGYLNPTLGRAELAMQGWRRPLCPFFGFSRGTPIDRYYLNQFIETIRAEVFGRTLDIGGIQANHQEYGLVRVTEYQTVDIDPNGHPDLVADVHTPDIFPRESFESVIAFNVLEHCARPWDVVNNIGAWLAPGGRFFCMVPNAQRTHAMPNDYWRPFPAGLQVLCSKLSILRMEVYGNLSASVASLSGVAAEEIGITVLDARDSRYPVASCIVAERPALT